MGVAHAFGLSKPFSTQSRPFSINALLLSMLAHKSNISSSIKQHSQSFPLDYSASLVQLFKELESVPENASLSKLESIFYRNEADVGAGFMLIQTQLQNGNTHAAAGTLEKIFHALRGADHVRYAPGLISLALLLFSKIGKEEKATSLLMDAKNYWTKQGSSVGYIHGISDNRM